MASTYLTRTAGTPTLNSKYTFSFWVKRHKLTYSECFIFDAREDGSNRFKLSFQSADKIECFNLNGGANTFDFVTNRMFRDPSAWYHIVLAVDTTLSSATDRVKLYVNGVQETSFASYNFNGSQSDTNNIFNENGRAITIGAYNGGGSYNNNADVSLTHVHFVDGTAYTPSTFGETDSTSGIWKPKTSPTVTYGNNGFFLKFENSGAMGTDSSGNSNTWTVAGTLTQNVDTPSNNFAVMNPLDNYYTVNTFSNGNTTVTTPNSGYSGAIGGMGVSSGKWYFEFKPISKTGDADEYAVGITGAPVTSTNQPHWKLATGYMYGAVNGNVFNNDSGSAYGNTYTAGDIIGVAMDLDNNKLYFSKNGTFQNSGVPTSGSTGTGATSITAASSTPIGFYLPCCAFSSNSYGAVMAFNFGSGYFQTTAVASANADGNGIGAFEYAVPSGYYALCTKNIKEFG